jgi:hypothetical protein
MSATLETFTQASERVACGYWKKLFSDAGHGKFPTGYVFRDGFLVYRGRYKNDKVETVRCVSSLDEFLPAVQAFFRRTSGLMPQHEQDATVLSSTSGSMERLISQASSSASGTELKWSKIVSGTQRRNLIDQFITRESETYNLTPTQRNEAYKTLMLGFCLGAFPTVHLSETGEIDRIEGWVYDSDTKRFKFKKPKTQPRKPVDVDAPSASDDPYAHVRDTLWMKPWIRLLRTLMSISPCSDEHTYTHSLNSVASSVSSPETVV